MRAPAKPLALAAFGLLAIAGIGNYHPTDSGAPAAGPVRAEARAEQSPPAPAVLAAPESAARARCRAQRLERERVAAGCIVSALLLGVVTGGPGAAAIAACGTGMAHAEPRDCDASQELLRSDDEAFVTHNSALMPR